MLAPIVLFVYNRPEHTLRTLQALKSNFLASSSELYIYADGAKPDASNVQIKVIEEVRRIIRSDQWCGKVYIKERLENIGLADSIISGVTEIINRHGNVIVLEDDIVTSPGFLNYMNDALAIYTHDEKVMHISGFLPHTTGASGLPETFFLRFMSCWGWATWKSKWDKLIVDTNFLQQEVIGRKDFRAFNLEGSVKIYEQLELNAKSIISTWAIKWYSTIFLGGGLCLYPNKSLVQQIGLDGTGVHCGNDNSGIFNVDLANRIQVKRVKIEESKKGKSYLKRFYLFGRDSSIMNRLSFYNEKYFKISNSS